MGEKISVTMKWIFQKYRTAGIIESLHQGLDLRILGIFLSSFVSPYPWTPMLLASWVIFETKAITKKSCIYLL